MAKIMGLLIGLVTLVVSIIISIILWTLGYPVFFLFFFLPLIGLSFSGFGKEKEERVVFIGKYCPRCGHKLEGWERYCPVCGYELRRG